MITLALNMVYKHDYLLQINVSVKDFWVLCWAL